MTTKRISLSPLVVRIGTGLWLTAAFAIFLRLLNNHWALQDWLFPRYASYFLGALVPVVAGALTGTALVEAIAPAGWKLPEKWVVGLAVGIVGFQLGWAALGFLKAWNTTSFVAWPLVYAAIGARSAPQLIRKAHKLALRVRARSRSLSVGEWLLLCAGATATALVYLPIMTPQNLAFDARWYHMPAAERYALEGGIVRFPEGWLVGTYPQLATMLYGWCFTAPTNSTFDHVELAAHLEFVLFLGTLGSIGVFARRLVPKDVAVPRGAWACIFLFPELFLYDSSVNGGADHIAAFFAIPIVLTLLLIWKRLPLNGIVLFAICVSGALATKVTASGLVLGPALGLLARAIFLGVQAQKARRLEARWVGSLLAFPAVVALLTTPYWLKNWVWYGNPVFPLAAEVFASKPWNSEASARLASLTGGGWRATHDLEGVTKTLSQAVLFSFEPSDWPTFHRDLPMFGSLFTLFLPVLIFRRTRSLMGVSACAVLGVTFWYWTYHQDRYLQAYLPWMVSCLVALWAIAWASGWFARAASLLLVVLQAVWGGDAAFFGTHAMAGQPLRTSMDLLAAGFAGKKNERFVAYGDMESLKKALPDDAVVLRHENQVHLGIGHRTVTDWFQAGISWSHRPGPAGVHAVMKEYQITHVMWVAGRSMGFDSIGSDLAFFNYALRHAEGAKSHGGHTLARVPETPPTGEDLSVVYLGCERRYRPGLYEVSELSQIPSHYRTLDSGRFPRPHPALPKDPVEATELVKKADTLVTNSHCVHLNGLQPSQSGFVQAAQRGEEVLWVRRGRARRTRP